MIEIGEALELAEIAAVRELFLEYEQALGFDLCFQGFQAELARLPGEYGRPRGRLLLARDQDGVTAGCVALRPLAADGCEMKRLYVRPAFRALGLGRRLVERVLEDARTLGYRRIHLDTLPSMEAAQRLYERLGFTDVPAYRDGPVPNARFMALDL